MKKLNVRLERASDLLLGLFVPKVAARAGIEPWCVATESCGWPRVLYYNVVKGNICGCW